MVEAALNAAAELVLEQGANGASLTRDGNRGPVGAPQNLYACRGDDAWLALSVTSDAQWAALVERHGCPGLGARSVARHRHGRRARHDEIDLGIGAWTATHEVGAAAEELLARGIPAAPVQSAAGRRRKSPAPRARLLREPRPPRRRHARVPGAGAALRQRSHITLRAAVADAG